MKLQNVIISFVMTPVCLSACLPARNISAPARHTVTEFHT